MSDNVYNFCNLIVNFFVALGTCGAVYLNLKSIKKNRNFLELKQIFPLFSPTTDWLNFMLSFDNNSDVDVEIVEYHIFFNACPLPFFDDNSSITKDLIPKMSRNKIINLSQNKNKEELKEWFDEIKKSTTLSISITTNIGNFIYKGKIKLNNKQNIIFFVCKK
jgi:hypothetical protein